MKVEQLMHLKIDVNGAWPMWGAKGGHQITTYRGGFDPITAHAMMNLIADAIRQREELNAAIAAMQEQVDAAITNKKEEGA